MFYAQVKQEKQEICLPTEPKTTVKFGKNGSIPQKIIFRITGHTQATFSRHQPLKAEFV